MEVDRPRLVALALAVLALAPALSGCVLPTNTRSAHLEALGPEEAAALALDPYACPPAPREPATGRVLWPEAPGPWSPWLVPQGAFLPPPPPGEDAAMEREELLALQAARTPEQEARAFEVEATPMAQPWTERFLELAHAHMDGPKGVPPRQAREMALLHVAMWDALVVAMRAQGCHSRPAPADEEPALRPLFDADARGSYPSTHAAVAGAAATVLEELYPQQGHRFWPDARQVGQSRMVAGVARASDVEAGLQLGRAVAQAVLDARRDDGAEAPSVSPERPPPGDCAWDATPPDYAPPMEPAWGRVEGFVVDAARLHAPAPPACDGDEWLAQTRALQEASANLTPEQQEAALRWAGSPPLDWLEIGLDATLDAGLNTTEQLRALTSLSLALADAGIVAWDVKFTFWAERPIHTIRRHWDPEWMPLVETPPFPGYVSGHSVFSGASSVVLARLLPEDAARFEALADEAAESRFWGGIHIRADIDVGLDLGRVVGEQVLLAQTPRGGTIG